MSSAFVTAISPALCRAGGCRDARPVASGGGAAVQPPRRTCRARAGSGARARTATTNTAWASRRTRSANALRRCGWLSTPRCAPWLERNGSGGNHENNNAVAADDAAAAQRLRVAGKRAGVTAVAGRQRHAPAGASEKRLANPAAVVIGTRGSPLALAQAYETKRLLEHYHPKLAEAAAHASSAAGAGSSASSADGRDGERSASEGGGGGCIIPGGVAIEIVHTTGDMVLDRALSELGGKGLFTREIDDAQLRGDIDIAVHSMKDVPTFLPDAIALPCMLAREDTRDVFISRLPGGGGTLADLPAGSVVGSSSLRRQSQILARYPHLRVVNFRGNVQTRLRKLREGVVDATLLAIAGLNRMRMTLSEVNGTVIGMHDMLPSVSQGAIGITARAGDARAHAYLAPLNCARTKLCVDAERAFLANLDGSCRTPIAGQAVLTTAATTSDGDGDDDNGDAAMDVERSAAVEFRGLVSHPDGSELFETTRACTAADALRVCGEAGEELKARVGPDFYVSVQGYVQQQEDEKARAKQVRQPQQQEHRGHRERE